MMVWMQEALPGLMQSGLAAGLAALAVALVCRLARPAPAVCHALWLLVLVRLMMPPLLEWPWGLPAAETVWGVRDPQVPAQVRKQPARTRPRRQPSEMSAEPTAAAEADSWTSAPSSSARLPLTAWIWLAGSLAAFAIQLLQAAGLRRSLSRTRPADDRLLQLVRQESARLGLRPPRVRVSERSAAPFVSGLLQPRLYWPAQLERSDARSIRPILVHELAHLKRRDLWAGLLDSAALCLWWWFPLLWLVRRKLREYSELACDAWAVSSHPQSRRNYARSLLELSQRRRRAADALCLPQPSFTSRASLERRLRFIYSGMVSARFTVRWAALVAVLGAVTLPAWTLQPAGGTKISEPTFAQTFSWQSAGSFVRGRVEVDEHRGAIRAMDEGAFVYLYTRGDDPSSGESLLAFPSPEGGIRQLFLSHGEESDRSSARSEAWLAQALQPCGLLELLDKTSPPPWRGRSYIGDSSGAGWRHSNLTVGDYVIAIWLQGEVRFAAGGAWIKELTPSSTLLMLAYRQDDPAVRLLEWNVAADGSASIHFSLQGRPSPFDAGVQAWFSPLFRELADDPVWAPSS